MKKIEAIIQSSELEKVINALTELGVEGLTLSEIRRFSRQKGAAKIYRGTPYISDFLPRTKLEITASDAAVDAIVLALAREAKLDEENISIFLFERAGRSRINARTQEEVLHS